MITAILPIAFVLVGGVLYFVSTNTKIQELGRLLFAAGVFALAFNLAGYKFSL